VLSGWLFELQLRSLRRARLHETGRTAKPLPQFGLVVWAFHPIAAVQHLSRIAGSRLHSVPVTVMDWQGAPAAVQEVAGVLPDVADCPVILAAPVSEPDALSAGGELRTPKRAGRTAVPDELYMVKLRELVAEVGGEMPSAREVARRLGIGQDRARRLLGALKDEHAKDMEPDATG
jgi:hypothetical protein